MDMEVALGADLMHAEGERQSDPVRRAEFHAAGAVMHMLNGAVMTDEQFDAILLWLHNLNESV